MYRRDVHWVIAGWSVETAEMVRVESHHINTHYFILCYNVGRAFLESFTYAILINKWRKKKKTTKKYKQISKSYENVYCFVTIASIGSFSSIWYFRVESHNGNEVNAFNSFTFLCSAVCTVAVQFIEFFFLHLIKLWLYLITFAIYEYIILLIILFIPNLLTLFKCLSHSFIHFPAAATHFHTKLFRFRDNPQLQQEQEQQP